jgi:hypothetical protein
MKEWQKLAYAESEDLDEKMERAFMSQAYSVIDTKAGALARDPYRIGFEVVYRNDENTRMVGMFAFKIGDELLYAPVFFLNGEVKGTDCLHRSSTKTIVPLTKDWTSFLIEKNRKTVSGEGVSKSVAAQLPSGVRLDLIAMPPGYKRACAELFESLQQVPEEMFCKEAGALLKEFIEDGGGFKAMSILGAAAEADPQFTQKLAFSMPAECYAPPLRGIYDSKKAAAPKGRLEVLSGLGVVGELSDGELALFSKQGFVVRDGRETSNEAILDGNDGEYTSINNPGIYEIHRLEEGGSERVLVARRAWLSDMLNPREGGSCGGSMDCCGGPGNSSWRTVCLEDGVAGSFYDDPGRHTGESPLGRLVADLGEARSEKGVVADPESGKAYYILDLEHQTLSDNPVKVDSVDKAEDGIRRIRFSGESKNSSLKMVQNMAIDGGIQSAGMAGSRILFVPAATEAPGENASWQNFSAPAGRIYPTASAMLMHLVGRGAVKKASVRLKASGTLQLSYDGSRLASQELSPEGMKLALASHLDIPYGEASELADLAVAKGSQGFLVTKKAYDSMPYLREDPVFDQEYDDYYGVAASSPERRVIPVDHPVDEPPEGGFGDGWDPAYADGLPRDVILGTDPSMLAQTAKSMGAPKVFEQNIIGSLLTSYDSEAMFDKYLPTLEKSVDALGRMIFLIYWKPGALQDIYGADDMGQLEQEILSNFKSQGDLLLKLLKKSSTLKRNTEN